MSAYGPGHQRLSALSATYRNQSQLAIFVEIRSADDPRLLALEALQGRRLALVPPHGLLATQGPVPIVPRRHDVFLSAIPSSAVVAVKFPSGLFSFGGLVCDGPASWSPKRSQERGEDPMSRAPLYPKRTDHCDKPEGKIGSQIKVLEISSLPSKVPTLREVDVESMI